MATKSEIANRVDFHMCPRYEKATEILGKRWTGLILRVLVEGPRRFNELTNLIAPLSDRLLTERLRELETEGIVQRLVYSERPVRIEYSLTEKGMAMRKVLDAIGQWAEDWIPLETRFEPETKPEID